MNISELEKRIKYLERENQYLKTLLADAGISYSDKDIDTETDSGSKYDQNQGARIIPRNITDTDAKLFFSMFWARTDVYSKRTIKKSTGEVNYYTQCSNFWKNGCPRITQSKIKCQDCPRRSYKELKKEQIIEHLRGNTADATDVIGVFPLFPDDTCRFIVFDFDNHEKNAEKSDFANADNAWKDEADSLRKICEINGIDALVERSRSGRGAHDSTTGIIDIAMVGSICKNNEYHKRLKEYGLILVDECHHAASGTIVDILQEANAKYVYGVTATPLRGDGLEKINYMLLGPIRYQYTSKDRAKEQGIEHLVYPRFTRAVAPRFAQDKMHPNEAYEIIRNNESRDELIISDVKQCVSDGRTPVVLSKYVEHSQRLYQRFKNCADKVFLLSGSNSQKEHKEILRQMNQVTSAESMILVATGKLIGEGFDYPRLDTLIMATPVAWKGVVEQYAGRLNRDYDGKKSVIIYDYVDIHISMFDRMYHKRLKAYKQIGYNIFSGTGTQKQMANAIFDIDNYADVYHNDLLAANKEIIISSPAISGKKVYDIIAMLKEKQENGVKTVIITWKPDSYGYGNSAYWHELHEQMRQAGFEMNLVEDYCEHYCIIDREIVWYGSLNFLGKEDAEDNLMRVDDAKIANELLEMTFGNGQCQGETI